MIQKTIAIIMTMIASILSTIATAQMLTQEETGFLKSLNGRWSDQQNSTGETADDFSIVYFNGALKISHPSECTITDRKWYIIKTTSTAQYDKSANGISFSYRFRIINTDDAKRGDSDFVDNIYMSFFIPYQDGIQDMMVVNYYRKHLDNNWISKEEKIYYKH